MSQLHCQKVDPCTNSRRVLLPFSKTKACRSGSAFGVPPVCLVKWKNNFKINHVGVSRAHGVWATERPESHQAPDLSALSIPSGPLGSVPKTTHPQVPKFCALYSLPGSRAALAAPEAPAGEILAWTTLAVFSQWLKVRDNNKSKQHGSIRYWQMRL